MDEEAFELDEVDDDEDENSFRNFLNGDLPFLARPPCEAAGAAGVDSVQLPSASVGSDAYSMPPPP